MKALDGSHGWAAGMWATLADGATWMIPRTGLVYVKDEQAKTLTLTEQMPWSNEMPVSAEDLLLAQDAEHKMMRLMFGYVGVEVLGDVGFTPSEEQPLGFCRYCYRARWIEEVEQTSPMIEGRCTQCVREGVTKPMSALSDQSEGAG